jgi:glycosyltransferase involved in cell wall biosynthesis
MRIVHILEATQGGTRRHVLDLLPRLVQAGHSCSLLYSLRRYAPFEADAQKLREQGVECFQVPMTNHFDLGINGRALPAIGALLRRGQPDLVHCHSTVAGLLGRLAASVAVPHVPLVYTPHCVAFDTGLGRFRRRSARLCEALLAWRTAAFVAVSSHEARLLATTIADRKRIFTVPNGLDLAAFDALQERPRKQEGPFRIGCFGRLSQQKNQVALIRALPLLRSRNVRLMLVGDGPLGAQWAQLAGRLGVESLIEWMGDVPEARPLYSRCAVVGQPSRWEGCPYAVLEGMAAGCAVLAAPVGGMPEMLGDVGLLCGTGPGQLAEKLAYLAGDETARDELAAAGRRRVEEHYTVEQMCRATQNVYAGLTSA